MILTGKRLIKSCSIATTSLLCYFVISARNQVIMWKLLGPSVFLLLLGALGSEVLAQTTAPESRGNQPPVILRTATRLVQINVIVHNHRGEPVEGLKKEKFTVLDQGIEQKIAAFSSISAAPRDAASVPTLPPNVFSNRGGAAAANPGSVTVILFDALNTAAQDQFYAREQVLKFLRQLQPQDHVAIYVLTTEILVLNEFTQDATTLLQAIQKFGGYSSPQQNAGSPVATTPETDARVSRLRRFLDASDYRLSDFDNVNRAELTTTAIEAIANHVARIPGRKSLIWVSASFPISIGLDSESPLSPDRDVRVFSAEVERAARALNQANMAIYPVDARGLMADQHFSGMNSSRFNPRSPTRNLGADYGNIYTMNALADRTGGKASYNNNDIEGAVRRAIADGQYTYTLGFYPTHGKWDGKFHELKVRVNGKGLSVRHRKGYLALPDPPAGPQENQAALDAAIGSPVEWTNLDLQVTLKSFDLPAHTIDVQVGLDPHELTPESKPSGTSYTLYLLFDQLGEGDKVVNNEKRTFQIVLAPEKYDWLMKNGAKLDGRLMLAPNAVNLRVIAQDPASGAIGTLTIPIKKYLASAASPQANPKAQIP
jgi:VWFA-related protein